jgi:hypothetical protein
MNHQGASVPAIGTGVVAGLRPMTARAIDDFHGGHGAKNWFGIGTHVPELLRLDCFPRPEM